MLRLLTIAAAALIGGFSFLRLWCAISLGSLAAAALYGILLPPIVPRWPAIVILSIAILGGLYWEHRASTRLQHR
ncbi:hypothetical protein O4G98_00855 [Zoogloeaceae bacterium G21618-S1]|nr:hypothetical protein [Zoogloeaceae bacterium G21618-S1]